MTVQRMHDIDVLRTIAVMMGIVFHGALSFMPSFIGWAVMDVSTSSAIPALVVISHSFRMPLFFMLAGFFTTLALRHCSLWNLAKSRLIRLGIPFILGWLLLRPLLVAGWIAGSQDMQGEINFASVWQGTLVTFEQLPQGLFIGTHLWFLYYLLLVTAIMLVVYSVAKPLLSVKTQKRANWHLAAIRLSVVAMTAVCMWFMSSWSIDTPDKSLLPQLPVLALYGICFAIGALLSQCNALFTELTRLSWYSLITMCFAITACLYLANFERQFGHPYYAVIKLGYALAYAVTMWSIIANLTGFCRRYFAKPNAISRYLADAAYSVYLLHLPVVIFVQIGVSELDFSWWIKLPLVCVVSLFVSLGLYDMLVRATWFGRLLNGKVNRSIVLAFVMQGRQRGSDESKRIA